MRATRRNTLVQSSVLYKSNSRSWQNEIRYSRILYMLRDADSGRPESGSIPSFRGDTTPHASLCPSLACHARHGHYTVHTDRHTVLAHENAVFDSPACDRHADIEGATCTWTCRARDTHVRLYGGSCTRPPVGRACRCTSHHHHPSAGATAGRRRLQEGKKRGSKKRGRQALRPAAHGRAPRSHYELPPALLELPAPLLLLPSPVPSDCHRRVWVCISSECISALETSACCCSSESGLREKSRCAFSQSVRSSK